MPDTSLSQPTPAATFYSLPEVYDILHASGTAKEVNGLERMARRFVTSRPLHQHTWLEPACGSGRYLRTAAARGHRVLGFDLNPGMVDYGNRSMASRLARSPGGPPTEHRVFVGDLTTFATTLQSEIPPGSVDFAFNMINTIRHLPSDHDMLAHFDQMAAVLHAGGVYALGFSLSAYGLEIPTEDIWVGRRGRCEVRQVVQYLPASGNGRGGRFERVISHLTVTRATRVDEIDFTYDLRSYDLAQWNSLVGRSRMEIIGTVREDASEIEATEPGYAIFLLRPRTTARR